jgi:hypothetical protein
MTATDAILTQREAMAFVKLTNTTSFFRWRKKWGARPLSRNRYALRALEAAVAREIRGRVAA